MKDSLFERIGTLMNRRTALLWIGLTAVGIPLWAGVPNRITYQGRLNKSGVAVAGAHTFVIRILSQDGTPLWSSGSITVGLPATGDFSIVLEPTGVDWAGDNPKLEVTVDGEKLSPADPFSSSPYSLVALQITDGAVTNAKVASGASIDPSKIAVSGAVTLANWRSGLNPEKINANVIQGTVPVSSNQIDGTAVVAHATFTQTMEPTQNVTPLAIKPKTGADPNVVNVLDLQAPDGATKVIVRGNGNVGIGVTNPSEKLEVGGRIRDVTGFVAPVGTIVMYGSSTPPDGWQMCDGSAISRATYAALFSVIGTNFGFGDGSSTFNLPDLRGRSPLGAGQGTGLTSRTLGSAFGEETHTLTTAEMPSHAHGPGNSTYFQNSNNNLDTGAAAGSPRYLVSLSPDNISAVTAATGGNGSHNNMPPALVLNFIIKY